MRSAVLFSALLLALGMGASGPGAAAGSPLGDSAIDHALVWGRDIDQVSAVMAVKLGFQVRPGRNPGGVANRYVRMADRSYLELLGITRPDSEMDPGMLADQAKLHGGPGARTFGLRASTLEEARAFLRQQGFAPTDIFTAAPTDPDGEGPSKPPRWRLFAFEQAALSSDLFYIDYAPTANAVRIADERSAQEHPNGAREVSALWLLSSDAQADRKQLARMGFTQTARVRFAQIAAEGYCVAVGHKRIFALQPAGAGMAADALRSGGPQVLGVSIAVADFEIAKRRVERGYERHLASYHGLLGDSFLAPTQDDLGMLIEFHALPAPDVASACDV